MRCTRCGSDEADDVLILGTDSADPICQDCASTMETLISPLLTSRDLVRLVARTATRAATARADYGATGASADAAKANDATYVADWTLEAVAREISRNMRHLAEHTARHRLRFPDAKSVCRCKKCSAPATPADAPSNASANKEQG